MTTPTVGLNRSAERRLIPKNIKVRGTHMHTQSVELEMCQECGCPVLDHAKHTEWHEAQNAVHEELKAAKASLDTLIFEIGRQAN